MSSAEDIEAKLSDQYQKINIKSIPYSFICSIFFKTSDIAPVSSKEFLDIQATIECGFTLKRVRDMIRTYSQTKAK